MPLFGTEDKSNSLESSVERNVHVEGLNRLNSDVRFGSRSFYVLVTLLGLKNVF